MAVLWRRKNVHRTTVLLRSVAQDINIRVTITFDTVTQYFYSMHKSRVKNITETRD